MYGVSTLELQCVTGGQFTHTSSPRSVGTNPGATQKVDNRSICSFFHHNKYLSLNNQSQLLSLPKIACLSDIKIRKSTSRMQPSRTFMIYEL